MKNFNSGDSQTQVLAEEILSTVLNGKNPDIRDFLINGMSKLLNMAFIR